MTLPVLPVLLALVVLEWIGVPDLSVSTTDVARERGAFASLYHGNGRLLFAAAVSIHTFVCFSAMIYFTMQIVRVGGPGRRAVTVMTAMVSVSVLAMMIALGFIDPPLAVYRYTYFQIEALIENFTVARDLIDPGDAVPTLAICVLYPSALGIIAVALASAAACTASIRIKLLVAHRQASAGLALHIRLLLHCFYVLSGVLVTSTATALLFFRLPLGLTRATPEGEALSSALSTYASGLGTFWAAIYTLTLFTVFAGPAAIVYTRVQKIMAGEGKGRSIAEWLRGNGISVSLGENIKNVFVLIAPLLVGPIGELVRLLGG